MAVKIVLSIQKYRDAVMIEIDVLNVPSKHDKSSSGCVEIRNWFDFQNDIGIVCERLGPSLLDFLAKTNITPDLFDIMPK